MAGATVLLGFSPPQETALHQFIDGLAGSRGADPQKRRRIADVERVRVGHEVEKLELREGEIVARHFPQHGPLDHLAHRPRQDAGATEKLKILTLDDFRGEGVLYVRKAAGAAFAPLTSLPKTVLGSLPRARARMCSATSYRIGMLTRVPPAPERAQLAPEQANRVPFLSEKRHTMRVLIISDVHGNYDALSSLVETYDELWVLGDLVNYGPEPAEVTDFVRTKATVIVSGNHDYSIGFNQDPRCSERFREMAEATRRFTDAALGPEPKHFLRNLPQRAERQCRDTHFYLCHAIPSDPLYGYCDADSARWLTEIASLKADVILVGHTHIPSVRSIGSRLVVNPGSLGQPKHGRPEAGYAIWEDGKIELKSFSYSVDEVVTKVQALPIQPHLRDELGTILMTGKVPLRL